MIYIMYIFFVVSQTWKQALCSLFHVVLLYVYHSSYQMRPYLLVISFAETARDIMSRLGRCAQVLAALNPMDPLHNCDV